MQAINTPVRPATAEIRSLCKSESPLSLGVESRGRSAVRRAHGGAVRSADRAGPGGRTLVSAVNLIGGIVAVLLAAFMVAALLFPEKF
jgi:K+-transporting ATPase KdpF subunit